MKWNSDGPNASHAIPFGMLLEHTSTKTGVDLMTIKTLLGHKSLESTTIYVHLAVSSKHTATSPFDILMDGDGHE